MALGRPKIIKTPECLLELFEGYKLWVIDNPVTKEVYNHNLDKMKVQNLGRPQSWEGFAVYVYKQTGLYNLDKYRYNEEEGYNDFRGVIKSIGGQIFEEQYAGATAGKYNASIVARKLQIAERTEIVSAPTINVIDMSKNKGKEE